ncbi:hypothetical protein C2S52_012145 [Perilla frutescens var. hirtella]|nr:hypothetical protein C2S52_012145 [Perilla frutescens var. hirtella]
MDHMDTAAFFYLLLCFLAINNNCFVEANAEAETPIIGVILDCSSRLGKEERVAMEIAIQDLNTQVHLHPKCSHARPLQAAQAARYLINRIRVEAILGPNSWEESSAVAEVAHQLNDVVPILSLSDSSPPWATARWPSLILASPPAPAQTKAVAAILESWKWSRVNIIYEDTESVSSDILNNLYSALHDAQVRVSGLLPLPPSASLDANSLQAELEKLKRGQCRVFVVHAGVALAERVFEKAKEMKMMERDFVWITTDATTSMVHSINASVIEFMQGVVGVRRYFPHRGNDFYQFCDKFSRSFRRKFPDEKNHDPGIFALQAYDAARAVGSAMNAQRRNGRTLMEEIVEVKFDGLSGKIEFHDRRLAPVNEFEIINVVGRSYWEVGLWSDDGLGFSRVNSPEHNVSMEILGRVFWPGAPVTTPRGWDLPTISNPLRIGVPNTSLTNKFVKVEYNPATMKYEISGFSIQVFNKTVEQLKYALPYELIPYQGRYTDLVKQVESKVFDAAVGDIAIIASRYEYVEFSHAHTESGLAMVVPILKHSNKTWLFMKPFTRAMWLLTVFINVYNGFVVWSIEKEYCAELKGPLLHQIATLVWLAFATLFSLHGERLHSNLSKMATVVWLFVALIITQSYTASLASMLTLQDIEPKIANIEVLKSENAYIGFSKASFVKEYLVGALQFKEDRVKNFTTPDDYAKALRSGDISAAFLEAPVAKLFVAKYCNSFVIAGPIYKVGGYGFAFPKGSPLVGDMDEALLSVFESGALRDLEISLIASEKCVEVQADNETASLSPHGFFMLFVFTGSTSTTALAIYYFRNRWKVVARHTRIWTIIFFLRNNYWRPPFDKPIFSRKVSDVQTPTTSPNPNHSDYI